jgi:hypothetical protein
VLAGGAPTGDAAAIMATVEGTGIATGPTADLRDRSHGSHVGPPGDLGDLDIAGHGTGEHVEGTSPVVESGPHRPRGHVEPRCEIDCGITGGGEFDIQLLVRAIRARTARITRCYEHELSDDPTLSGRVAIALTVEERGTLSHVRAVENTTGSEAIASCITGAIRDIRVNPGPTGGTVSAEFPFVFQPAD